MELVLPNNDVDIDQDEMMYLDGGDWNTFKRNIKGLGNASAGFRHAAQQIGLWAAVWSTRTYAYSYVVSMLAPVLGSVTAANFVLGAIGVATLGAVGYALWNYKYY